MVLHTISPVYDNNSRVLVLGSFPSVKSREEGFFYGHKQNRFWKVLSNCFDCALPQTIDEKKKLLLSNGVALWDVIYSCDITGSSDSSIKNAVPNDISKILAAANIQKIITNGKKADTLYKKYIVALFISPYFISSSASLSNFCAICFAFSSLVPIAVIYALIFGSVPDGRTITLLPSVRV